MRWKTKEALKSLVRRHPLVYRALDLLTKLDREHLALSFTKDQYLSPYGGTWVDRKDFESQLAERIRTGKVPAHLAEPLRNWRRDGFIILPGIIDPALIDRYLEDIEREKAKPDCRLLMTGSKFKGIQPFRAEGVKPDASVRIVDDYWLFDSSRSILLHPRIQEFLSAVFETGPLLTQSLCFTYGSQQDIHVDTAFVGMSSPNKMAAAWVALQDVTPGSGELLYYPRSHLWEEFLFSGSFILYDTERDGEEQIQAFFESLEMKAKRDGLERTSFLPKKGDVFLWHAKLAHGGNRILDPEKTRRSLVGHFCPQGIRPSYHHFNPSKRSTLPHGAARYSSQSYPYEGMG